MITTDRVGNKYYWWDIDEVEPPISRLQTHQKYHRHHHHISSRMKDRLALSRLVVKFRDLPDLPYLPESQPGRYFLQRHIRKWNSFPDSFPGITIKSLFTTLNPGRIRRWMNKALKSDPTYQAEDLLSYFTIDCDPGTGTDKLLRRLSQCKEVELAYREMDGYLPLANSYKEIIYSGQEYLGTAPKGIDAVHARRISGGDGAGKVRFIDIEKGWMLNHEALRVNIFLTPALTACLCRTWSGCFGYRDDATQ